MSRPFIKPLAATVVIAIGVVGTYFATADAGQTTPPVENNSMAIEATTSTVPSTTVPPVTVPPTTVPPTTTPPAPATTKTTPAPIASDFDTRVKNFYAEYTGVEGDGRKLVMDRYMTQSASDKTWTKNADYDTVLCAQNTPARVSVSEPRVIGSKVSVSVTTRVLEGAPMTFTVEGRVSDGRITAIDCRS